MKHLKRILLVAMAMLAIAGTAEARIVKFGVKAGMNINKMHFKNFSDNFNLNKSNSEGWEAGAMAEVQVPVIGLCFDASLMYQRMNNGKEDYGRDFLTIPINLKYKFNLPAVSNLVAPFLYTGPEFAFRLDHNVLKEMKTKTCQIAWNVGLGVELINHLQVAASYGFGINNIVRYTDWGKNATARNNYWTITGAWLF